MHTRSAPGADNTVSHPSAAAFPVGSPPEKLRARDTPPRGAGAAPLARAAAEEGLRRWLADFRAADGVPAPAKMRGARIADGVALARERRARMVRLIREDPQQALREALRFDEYDALPAEVRVLVERPFSERVSLLHFPICGAPAAAAAGGAAPGRTHLLELCFGDGTRATAFSYGRREALTSKRSLPASGVVLDGTAALAETVFREVAPQERAQVGSRFAPGQADLGRSFVTGRTLGDAGLMALAGDKLYAFADRAELDQVEQALGALDAFPGDEAGSSALYRQSLPLGAGGTFDPGAALDYARLVSGEWTETPKALFLIRVDFSDHPGAPVEQAAALTELNGPTSSAIRAMSYDKTWINAGVSANVYQLPQSAAYYADTDNPEYGTDGFTSRHTELLCDARNTFRTTKSGADATVDIGPVSDVGTGDGGGLGTYDIVGICFGEIGMYSGGVHYAGLASIGAGDLWIQNSAVTDTFTHELGHNYGVGHASFWQTSDGSVVGEGDSVEYGDIYDIMGDGPADKGHLHPQAKARLNWLSATDWTDVSASGTCRLYRIDHQETQGTPRGLRLTKAPTPGAEEYYWIAYRPSFTDNPHLTRGAYIVWQRPGQNRCWLLDMTPESADGKLDAALDPGRTYSDTGAQIHLTPLVAGGTGTPDQYLDVQVNLGAFADNHAPTATGITGSATIAARTQSTFVVNAVDQDADALACHWTTGDGVVHGSDLTLAHAWTVGGTYEVSATVSDMKGGTATATLTVTVTDPLDTWTEGDIGATNYNDLWDVVWAKGRFVAAEYCGVGVYLSWDGVTWTRSGPPYPLEPQEPQLAYGGGTFVLCGKINQDGSYTAQICHSHDGRTWQGASFPADAPQARDVAHGGGRFVAVCDDGVVLRSTDGATWELATVPDTPDFRHVIWDGAAWIAVAPIDGGTDDEQVWTSSDGESWTRRDSLEVDVHGLFARDGTAYATGWYAGILYSTDHGLSWLPATTPGETRWSTSHMAAADDGILLVLARAMDEVDTPCAWLVSTDGRSWARVPGGGDVEDVQGLAFGAGKFLTVDFDGVTRSGASLHPTNAAPTVDFTVAPAAGDARRLVHFAAAASDPDGDPLHYAWDFGGETVIEDGFEIAPWFAFGDRYDLTLRVSDGRGGLAAITHTIDVSDPARSWTARTSGVTVDLNAVAANAGTAVAVGLASDDTFMTILTTNDGVTWTRQNTGVWSANVHLYGVAWTGSAFIAVGEDYDWDLGADGSWIGVVYTSLDGVTWTRTFKGTDAGRVLKAVCSNGAISVAVGDNGSVLRSINDGQNWAAVTVPDLETAQLTGIAPGGGMFALVGCNGDDPVRPGKVYTSTDGLTWVDQSAGVGLVTPSWQFLKSVAWLNDRFVAGGHYTRLQTSTDAGQTFTTPRSQLLKEDPRAMAYGDGIYLAAGVAHGDTADTAVDLMSLDGVNWVALDAPTVNQRNGAVFFRQTFITVGPGGAIWQSGDVTPPGGWPAWQWTHFPGGGLDALPDRDPDRDGDPNLVEYALDRDPNSTQGADGAAGAGRASFHDGRCWLRLDMPEPAVPDAIHSILGTTDLRGSWTTLARKTGASAWEWIADGTPHLLAEPAAGGRQTVEIGMPDDAVASPRYFLRLELEMP